MCRVSGMKILAYGKARVSRRSHRLPSRLPVGALRSCATSGANCCAAMRRGNGGVDAHYPVAAAATRALPQAMHLSPLCGEIRMNH